MNYQQIKAVVFYILSKEIMSYEDTQFLNEYGTYELILDYIEENSVAIDPNEVFDEDVSILELMKLINPN
jgi:hypothetical protein